MEQINILIMGGKSYRMRSKDILRQQYDTLRHGGRVKRMTRKAASAIWHMPDAVYYSSCGLTGNKNDEKEFLKNITIIVGSREQAGYSFPDIKL